MTTNNDKNEDYKFKTIENEGFGSSNKEKVDLGDLVSWDSWGESIETEVFEEKSGVLVKIWKEKRLSGWGWMTEIIPLGGGKRVNLPLISLRKMKNGD